jgi:hypothetical protein
MNILVRHLDDKIHRAAKVAAICRRQSFNKFVLEAVNSAVTKAAAKEEVVAIVLKQRKRDDGSGSAMS